MKKLKKFLSYFSLRNISLALFMTGAAGVAMAAGDGMPWDGPLCGLATALRGPAALAISTIAFFAAGAAFLWGEEIAGMSKKLVTIFMAITILLGSASLVGWIAVKMGAATAACS